jgi:hypothetical protein
MEEAHEIMYESEMEPGLILAKNMIDNIGRG